jgi:RHS repeat-associated protein
MTETQTLTGGNPNQLTSDVLTWNDAAGNPRSVTVTYSSFTQKTTFGCSTFGDVTKTGQYSPTTIVTPEGNYTITYEPTSGFPQDITGRIKTITNPQGGSESFAYSGGNSGIVCPTSSGGPTRGAVLTETFDDGHGHTSQKKYDTTVVSNSTVVTTPNPSGNDTVYTFSVKTIGAVGVPFIQNFQTKRVAYQGSRTAGTVLNTLVTCYNGTPVANCPTATNIDINNITAVDSYDTLGGMSTSSRVQVTYGSLLLPLSKNQYDFGASTATIQTQIVYGTWNGSTCVAIGNSILNRPCTVTVSSGSNQQALTRAAYTSKGNQTDLWKWVSGTTFLHSSATYNTNGTVASSYDVNGAQTTPSYGACNSLRATSVSLPLGLSRSMIWDCNGDVVTSVTDENLQITSLNHTTTNGVADPFWRIMAGIDPLNNTTNYTYTATTTERAMLFNSNASTDDVTTTIDGLGRAIDVQRKQAPGSNSFDTVTLQYDTAGHLYSTSLPCSAGAGASCPSTPATTQTSDGLNRPLVTTDGGAGTVTKTYSKNDVLSVLGPAPSGESLKQKRFEYDGLGRLTSVCEITSASGSGTCGQSNPQTGFWTRYKYDALGNLVGVCENTSQPLTVDCVQTPSSAQQTRTYAYDGIGRLISETNPESGTTTYTYDTDATCGTSNGDLVKTIDAIGNTICNAYDALHRTSSTTFSGPNPTTNRYFVYDAATVNGQAMANANGRIAEAYTATCSTCTKVTDEGMGYSARGELSDFYESTPHSAGYYHVPMTYWANGLMKTSGPFLTESQVSITPDGEGRPYAFSGGYSNVPSITYNSASQPTQLMTSCAGSTCYPINYTYDPNTLRMSQYSAALNTGTVSGTLTWNPNGSLQKLIVANPTNSADAQTCTYAADDLGRIASTTCGSTWAQTFSYDPFGNITKSGSVSWTPGYSSSTNHYSLAGTSYDSNGNLLGDTFNTYTWDAEGKPLSTNGARGYTYDAFGHMVELSLNGTYKYSYVKLGKLRFSATGQAAGYSETPLPGGSLTSQNGGATGVQLADWLGTIRASYSYSGGNEGQSGAHAPFGEAYAYPGGYPTGFTGQGGMGWGEGDDGNMPDTTYWFPERQYRTAQGRWLSPDPAGLSAVDPANPQTWNRYAYVANNPLGSTDPLGLDGGDLCNMAGGGGGYYPSNGGGYTYLPSFSSYVNVTLGNFECASHDVPRAPWEVQTSFTGFSGPMGIFNGAGPMGIFSGEDCLGCWPLGPDPMQILAQVLSGNLAGALQDSGVIPPMTNCLPICDATKADPTLDNRANALAGAINRTGVQNLRNPCTIGLFYGASGGGAALATVDGTAVVATAETYSIPATGLLGLLYKVNPATAARFVDNTLQKGARALRAVQSACTWIGSLNW